MLIIALITIPIIVVIVFSSLHGRGVLNLNHNSGWVTRIAGILTYLGTVTLGVVAIRQNEKLREDNEKNKAQLKDFNDNLLDKMAEQRDSIETDN